MSAHIQQHIHRDSQTFQVWRGWLKSLASATADIYLFGKKTINEAFNN